MKTTLPLVSPKSLYTFRMAASLGPFYDHIVYDRFAVALDSTVSINFTLSSIVYKQSQIPLIVSHSLVDVIG